MTTPTTSRLAVILTAAFWQAAGARALRTVLVAILPFLAPLITNPGGETLRQAGATLALAALLSLATSWANLPELGDGRGPWAAVLDRSARTFGQTLVAALAAAVVWSDIDWPTLLAQALAAALTTAILATVEQLPETVPLVEADAGPDGVEIVHWACPACGAEHAHLVATAGPSRVVCGFCDPVTSYWVSAAGDVTPIVPSTPNV